MNTKEEILRRLEELLESERYAARMDQEIIDGLGQEKMIGFFEGLKGEEERHERIVKGLIETFKGD
ncbi:MAG: hypothetical protein JW754_01325 [Candidatus Aenigmarchaeota archaeon]|nr:hypothetical protein [Candidatus Aenigmarchaeota archaeon]